MDKWDKGDIQIAIGQIDKLLASGIFDPKNAGHPLFRAAFVDLLINLRDLMYKTEKYASRISFTDEVKVTRSARRMVRVIGTLAADKGAPGDI